MINYQICKSDIYYIRLISFIIFDKHTYVYIIDGYGIYFESGSLNWKNQVWNIYHLNATFSLFAKLRITGILYKHALFSSQTVNQAIVSQATGYRPLALCFNRRISKARGNRGSEIKAYFCQAFPEKNNHAIKKKMRLTRVHANKREAAHNRRTSAIARVRLFFPLWLFACVPRAARREISGMPEFCSRAPEPLLLLLLRARFAIVTRGWLAVSERVMVNAGFSRTCKEKLLK